MFWKRKSAVAGQVSEPKLNDEDLQWTELKDDEIHVVATAIITCLPPALRAEWHFQRFQLMAGDIPENSNLTLENVREVYEVSIVMHSWMLFDEMSKPDPFATLSQYTDAESKLETLENYLALAESSEEFRRISARFSKGCEIVFPKEKLVPLVDGLLHASRSEDDLLITERVEEYRNILVPEVHRLVAVNTNKYGKANYVPAEQEVDEFWCSVPGAEFSTYTAEGVIEKTIAHILSAYPDAWLKAESVPVGGAAFEVWCLKHLREAGVDSHLSQSGADQGIDIIASVNERRIGIQCKRYSSPVGNKAVQEALAGKSFYDLDAVCVVSTGGYTRSAQDLSKRAGVVLLSENDLSKISDLCG